MIPDAFELSICIGVGCCGCPLSSNVFLITSTYLVLMNGPPNSASAAEAMTELLRPLILHHCVWLVNWDQSGHLGRSVLLL